MESHEEKLHQMIQISKMESAKDQARDAARSIRDRQREQQRLGIGSSSMPGNSLVPIYSLICACLLTHPQVSVVVVAVAVTSNHQCPPLARMIIEAPTCPRTRIHQAA